MQTSCQFPSKTILIKRVRSSGAGLVEEELGYVPRPGTTFSVVVVDELTVGCNFFGVVRIRIVDGTVLIVVISVAVVVVDDALVDEVSVVVPTEFPVVLSMVVEALIPPAVVIVDAVLITVLSEETFVSVAEADVKVDIDVDVAVDVAGDVDSVVDI